MRKILFLALSVLSLFSCNRRDDSSGIQSDDDSYFGLDVSEFQGKIDWEKLMSQDKYKIDFVLIRATCGDDRKDKRFKINFLKAKEKNLKVGLYHYYDPNENSTRQAKNYIAEAKPRLASGDFFPAVDIERLSGIQSLERLKKGLRNWLAIVEKEFGVKPIIYTGYSYYSDYLLEEFSGYPTWIAAYSRDQGLIKKAAIHQFSQELQIPGIPKRYKVDGNRIPQDRLAAILLP